MLTGEIRPQIDRVWNAFWTGGLANPLIVIEQMTYLLFIRRLDELHTARERQAALTKEPICCLAAQVISLRTRKADHANTR